MITLVGHFRDFGVVHSIVQSLVIQPSLTFIFLALLSHLVSLRRKTAGRLGCKHWNSGGSRGRWRDHTVARLDTEHEGIVSLTFLLPFSFHSSEVCITSRRLESCKAFLCFHILSSYFVLWLWLFFYNFVSPVRHSFLVCYSALGWSECFLCIVVCVINVVVTLNLANILTKSFWSECFLCIVVCNPLFFFFLSFFQFVLKLC